jgi:hypothetical protein
MYKSMLKVVALAVLSLFICAGFASADSQVFTLMVFSNEKTVLVDGGEVKKLVDFDYEVEKNATIKIMDEPYVSYKGTLIAGEIKVEASNDILEESFESGDNVNIEYYLVKGDDDVKKHEFVDCKITDVEIVEKGGEIEEVIYSFRASSLAER